MLTKVPESILEKVYAPQEEIILNGPPSSLKGRMRLHNDNDVTARVRSLDLMTPENVNYTKGIGGRLYINTKLRPGETRVEHVSTSLPQDTPPGTYELLIAIGGKTCKVKMVVQPALSIEAEPTEFTFLGTGPDTKHVATVTITNTGNLPFQIPQVSHVAPLDMDMLCRAFGYGFRKNKDDGFTQTMDLVTQNLKENLPDWARAKVEQAGQILQPGESRLVNFVVTMPKDSIADNDYDLLVRFWDIDLSFVFKSHQESKR